MLCLTHRHICKYYKCTNLNWYIDSLWSHSFSIFFYVVVIVPLLKKGLCRLFTIFKSNWNHQYHHYKCATVTHRTHFNFCFCLPMRRSSFFFYCLQPILQSNSISCYLFFLLVTDLMSHLVPGFKGDFYFISWKKKITRKMTISNSFLLATHVWFDDGKWFSREYLQWQLHQ